MPRDPGPVPELTAEERTWLADNAIPVDQAQLERDVGAWFAWASSQTQGGP